jgi:hypothetical protein
VTTKRPDPVLAEAPPLADLGQLRRVEGVAIALATSGALAYAVAGHGQPALVLTLAGAASIVGFRSLQGLVGLLYAQPRGRVGWQATLLFLLRATLMGSLGAALLFLGKDDTLALLLGISVIPAALMIEAGVLLWRATVGDDRHG